jgi:hypothetical protein
VKAGSFAISALCTKFMHVKDVVHGLGVPRALENRHREHEEKSRVSFESYHFDVDSWTVEKRGRNMAERDECLDSAISLDQALKGSRLVGDWQNSSSHVEKHDVQQKHRTLS